MAATPIRLCSSTPLDSSQHTLFPRVSPVPINPRTSDPEAESGYYQPGLEASAARCSWIPMCLICRPCLPTHFIHLSLSVCVSLAAFPGYHMWGSAHRARQQQLHLPVISFAKRRLAYNMHNKVTSGSYWWRQVQDNAREKRQPAPKLFLPVDLTPPRPTPVPAHESPPTD